MTKKNDELQIKQQQQVDAWQRTLPTVMKKADGAEVMADEADHKALRVHIRTAGRTAYTFDFKVKYLDSREVHVQFIDVEREGVSVDERTVTVQELIQDYTRDLHECAQALQELTHA